MPKSQYVDPGKAFDAGYIHFEDIPVCQYNKTLEEECKIYSKEECSTAHLGSGFQRQVTLSRGGTECG